jgi:tRNA A-37 threonylcarbamoyl transferase component Bud32
MSPENHPVLKTDLGNVTFADTQTAALLKDHIDALCTPTKTGWQVVKHNPSRTVYRGTIGQQEYYLKHFHSQSIWHRLGKQIGLYHARREMHIACYLNSRGISALPVVAAMWGKKCQWVLSQAVTGASSGVAWHKLQLERRSSARGIIDHAVLELADLIGQMHRCGVVHHDLHADNVMVRTTGQQVSLVLMDLHRAGRRFHLSRRAQAANLAQLLHDRYEATTRTQRLRFLRRYLQASGQGGTLVGWQRLIQHFAAGHRRRIYNHSQRRIFGSNRYFAPIKLSSGWQGQAVLASKHTQEFSAADKYTFTAGDWSAALADIEGLFTGPNVQVIKDSRSGVVVRNHLTVAGREIDVFIKRPRRKVRWKVLLDCLRPARPMRAFDMGHRLLIRGVATALPLVCLERRVGPILTDSILITETVPGLPLDQFLLTCTAGPACEASQVASSLTPYKRQLIIREVLAGIGRLLQSLHNNNFAHRDMKETNLLVSWSLQQQPRIVLLDLDGLRHVWNMTMRRRFQALMRLNVAMLTSQAINQAGRMRMLLGYLRYPGCGRIDFKPYWRVLEQWSGKKLHQQIHSLRKKQKALRRPTR